MYVRKVYNRYNENINYVYNISLIYNYIAQVIELPYSSLSDLFPLLKKTDERQKKDNTQARTHAGATLNFV